MLGWSVGNEDRIKLVIDPIVGLNTSYALSDNLWEYLLNFGIGTLKQACNMREAGNFDQSYWLMVKNLEPDGDWKEEWMQ